MTRHIDKIAQIAYENVVIPSEENQLLFQHAVLCQVYLPYKDLGPEHTTWKRQQGKAYFHMRSNAVFNPETEEFDTILGLPYGPKARLVLSYINTLALQQQRADIEIAESITSFVKSCRLSANGTQIKAFKNQIARLASTSISIAFSPEAKRVIQVDSKIIKGYDLWFPKNPHQQVIWDNNIVLSDDYFNSLINHAVPLDARHVAALSNNSFALDLYAWLAQRLHRVKGKEFVHWAGLKEQFGQGYDRMDNFKAIFRKTLKVVLTQYTKAKLEEDGIKGFILIQSEPPVPPKFKELPHIKTIQH